MTVSGKTIAQNVETSECHNPDVIRSLEQPLYRDGSLAVLHGNLSPNGAVMKTSAASPHLLQHTGRAVVFERYEEMLQKIDDPALDVVESCMVVLEKGGPWGGDGSGRAARRDFGFPGPWVGWGPRLHKREGREGREQPQPKGVTPAARDPRMG